MSLVIAHNISALTAQHNLTSSSRSLTRSIEKLSSGLKVNRGADGPAALVISEKQRAQIAGLNKAIENSEKGISLVQPAEGGPDGNQPPFSQDPESCSRFSQCRGQR